jgi:hypothetical protein
MLFKMISLLINFINHDAYRGEQAISSTLLFYHSSTSATSKEQRQLQSFSQKNSRKK